METGLIPYDPGPLTQTEERRITAPNQEWSDDFALKIVNADFATAATFRNNNHDWRFVNSDSLYLGTVPQKYWEGTKIPRANLSPMTSYEQVETIVPKVMQALFADEPWFESEKMGRTTAKAARTVKDIILSQLEECKVRKIVEIAIRSGLIYGNGPMELSWLYSSQMVKKFVPKFIPRRKQVFHPLLGPVNVPIPGYDRVIRETEEEEYTNRPMLENIDIRDWYIDPNCPTSDPEDARYTVTRKYKDADWLKSFREVDGFNVPSDAAIVEMCQQKPSAQSDNTKQMQEAARFGQWNPQVDQTVDPGGGRFELLCYKTARRIVWVANQSYVIYNIPNPYGKKMQYNFSYTDVLSRFFGMAVTDVVESEQRLQEGVLNARIDELALNIHPTTVVSSANREPVYKLRVRPGGVNYSPNPKEDMLRQFTNNVTQQAFMETQASDIRVQKLTGLADTASGGQNPVARSATGAGLQGQATISRTQYQVEKVEDNVLQPMLADVHTLNQHHLDPDQRIEALNGEEIDPLELFGAKVKFKMRAGSRMASRAGLLQALPLIFQEMVSPQLQSQLTQQGKTIDFEEVFQMVLDATGFRNKATWVRDLSAQEKLALQEAMQHPQNAELQKQRERLTAMSEMNQDKGDIALAQTAVKGQTALALADKKAASDEKKGKAKAK